MVHDPKSTETDKEDFQQTGDLFASCLLLSARRDYRFSMIENMLKESGIPFFTRGRGPGGYLKVVSGYSMLYETELYVYKKDYEQAKDLVDAFFSDAEPDGGYPVVEEFSDGGYPAAGDLTDEGSVFNRRTIARIFIAIPLILLLAAAIYAAIMTFQQFNNPADGPTSGMNTVTTTITNTVQRHSTGASAVHHHSYGA